MSPLQYYSYMDLILLVSHKEYWAVVWGMKQQSSGVTSVQQCTYGSILLLPQGAVETSWHLELGWLSEHTGQLLSRKKSLPPPLLPLIGIIMAIAINCAAPLIIIGNRLFASKINRHYLQKIGRKYQQQCPLDDQ